MEMSRREFGTTVAGSVGAASLTGRGVDSQSRVTAEEARALYARSISVDAHGREVAQVYEGQREQVVCGYGRSVECHHAAQHVRRVLSEGTPKKVTDGSTSSESHSQVQTVRCSLVTVRTRLVINKTGRSARHSLTAHRTIPRTVHLGGPR